LTIRDPKVAVVTGANRGIGLEFVHQLLTDEWEVVAGYRDAGKSQELLSIVSTTGRLHPFKLDVTKEADAEQLRDFVSSQFGRLDLLINNAGISLAGKDPVDVVRVSDITDNFEVNVIGPMMVTRKLHPLLANGRKPKVVNIGSRLGSVQLSSGNIVPYRLSKSALNMLTKIQSEAYSPDGIAVVVVSPGWVRTDMGGDHASLSPEESVSAMLRQIDKLNEKKSGRFISIDGAKIPY